VYEDNFTVNSRVGSHAAVVIASGEVDLHTSTLLRSELWKAIEQTTVAVVVLDASNVGFVSSGGLAVLVTAARRAEQRHKRFVVVTGGHRVIPRTLRIAGLDQFVSTYSTYADAMAVRTLGTPPGSDHEAVPAACGRRTP
jgi:anti-anti-sigma factor